MESSTTHPEGPPIPEPVKEHQWLRQLLGEWTVESSTEGEKPVEVRPWTENGRMIGELWIVIEGAGTMPGDVHGETMMTLGYDPQKGRFVGTWTGSMMTHQWVYNGVLDESGKRLVLDTEGPDFEKPGVTRRYRDIIEMVGDGHRVLRSQILSHDGEWQELMTSRYRRAD